MAEFKVSMKLSVYCKPCWAPAVYQGLEHLTGGELHKFVCPKCGTETYLHEGD
ncbi:hypothetical protein LCGC14_1264670 [marine sediment metagenome]|uniref:Uncharacterized protein n=1 Tax=marine sediment metagenome TaxID=412755 RepID=A0A0F9NGP0_9ZZZZ